MISVRGYVALLLGMVFWLGFFQVFLPMLILPGWVIHTPIYPKVSWLISNVQILFFTLFLFRYEGRLVEPKVVVPVSLLFLLVANLLPFLNGGGFGKSYFLNWGLPAVWVWSCTFLVSYGLLWRRTRFAVYLASWSMVCASLFYEFPLFSQGDPWYLVYNPNSLLFIQTRLLAFIFLLFGFYEVFRRSRRRWLTVLGFCIGYLVFSVGFYWALKAGYGYYFNAWSFRLPTALWMIALITAVSSRFRRRIK